MSAITPGPRNLITDVTGLKVGNAQSPDTASGVTVVLPSADGAVAAVDTRGGAPGTRETDALRPTSLVDRVNAIVLSGGSAFGLDAAGGVQSWLAKRGVGYEAAGHRIPIVAQAILFDLANGGNKEWGDTPPYRDLALAACDTACREFSLGNEGAGYGAVAGKVKGGLGSSSIIDTETGFTVGSLIAVNSIGSAVMPDGETLWAWPFELNGEYALPSPKPRLTGGEIVTKRRQAPIENTTIGVVATDAPVTVAQAERLAIMAHDGLARAIHPIHTPFDGDTLFVLSTAAPGTETIDPSTLSRIGTLAADCVSRSVGRGIVSAKPLNGIPAFNKP